MPPTRAVTHFAGVLAASIALLGGAREAAGYCRSSVCADGQQGQVCDPPQASDCGVPLFWSSSCVGYSVQRDASDQIGLDHARSLVGQAFGSWQATSCDGGSVSIRAEDLGPVSCDQVAYDVESKNANVIVFRDDSWPHDPTALALTTVNYNRETGEVRNADMEINSAETTLTTSDQNVDVDLLSILTHEAGHFLGLAHSANADATMFDKYPPSSITQRTLEPDDVAGICAAYPPGRSATCDPEPVNGLGDACGEAKDEEASCSVRPGGTRTSDGSALLLAATVGLATRVRGRR